MCFDIILFNLFTRKNKITPQNILIESFNKLDIIINQYTQFISYIFPNEIVIPFILRRTVYNTRSEFVAQFNAIYNYIVSELEYNSYPYNYYSSINNYKIIFNDIDMDFNRNLLVLNETNDLFVERTIIHNNSFIYLFKNINQPKIYNTRLKHYIDIPLEVSNID